MFTTLMPLATACWTRGIRPVPKIGCRMMPSYWPEVMTSWSWEYWVCGLSPPRRPWPAQLVGDAVEFGVDLSLEEEVRLLEGVIVGLCGAARFVVDHEHHEQ